MKTETSKNKKRKKKILYIQKSKGQAWWLTHVIPAIQEAEMRRIEFEV
jgi:hypothetical protein